MKFFRLPVLKSKKSSKEKDVSQLDQPATLTKHSKLQTPQAQDLKLPSIFQESILKASRGCHHSVQVYRVHSTEDNIQLFNCTGMKQKTDYVEGLTVVRVHLCDSKLD